MWQTSPAADGRITLGASASRQLPLQQLDIPEHDHQQIVEVMRHAAGHAAERFHARGAFAQRDLLPRRYDFAADQPQQQRGQQRRADAGKPEHPERAGEGRVEQRGRNRDMRGPAGLGRFGECRDHLIAAEARAFIDALGSGLARGNRVFGGLAADIVRGPRRGRDHVVAVNQEGAPRRIDICRGEGGGKILQRDRHKEDEFHLLAVVQHRHAQVDLTLARRRRAGP